MTLRPWKTVRSTTLYSSPRRVTLCREAVRLPDGRLIRDYHQVRMIHYVVIFAQLPDGRVLVERQYKHGARRVALFLPAGGVESGETPLAAARRELREETGHAASQWRSLGSFTANASYGCGTAHLFHATGCRETKKAASDDLEEMELLRMTPAALTRALAEGKVGALAAAAGIALARLYSDGTSRGNGGSRSPRASKAASRSAPGRGRRSGRG